MTRNVEFVFDATIELELDRAKRVLAAGMPVLLQGDTGTGKEVFARELHRRLGRPRAPFIAINCAGIPESLIESELFGYNEGAFTGARRNGSRGLLRDADGGVLFLDEIGDMPLHLQARLLRTLQDSEVRPLGGRPVTIDVAVISATHCNLKDCVQRNEFRGDLYFRISDYTVHLPRLRDRPNRRALIESIWKNQAAQTGTRIAADALAALTAYDWPGNLRQLVGAIQTLIALAGPGGHVGMLDLPPEVRSGVSATGSTAHGLPASVTLNEMTNQAIRDAIDAAGGNITAAARRLGVSRSTLYRHLP